MIPLLFLILTATGPTFTLPTFELDLPPTIFGNPRPACTCVRKELTLVLVTNQNSGCLRLTYTTGKQFKSSGLATVGEAGVYLWNSGSFSILPVLSFGLKYSKRAERLSFALGLSLGIPELIMPSFDLGLISNRREFITLRFGPVSSVTYHTASFDIAFFVNLFSPDLDFLTDVFPGLAIGMRI